MSTTTVPSTVPPQSFRSVYRLVPAPVAVVMTKTATDSTLGITCTSAGSLSATPAMATFSVDVKTSFADALRGSEIFSVNYLSSERSDIARAFSRGGADLASFAHLIHSDEFTQMPTLLSGTVAVLQCRLETILRSGDHDLVTGTIIRSRHQSDSTALIYSGGSYGAFCPATSGKTY